MEKTNQEAQDLWKVAGYISAYQVALNGFYELKLLHDYSCIADDVSSREKSIVLAARLRNQLNSLSNSVPQDIRNRVVGEFPSLSTLESFVNNILKKA